MKPGLLWIHDTDLFVEVGGGLSSTFLTADFNLGISNLCGSVNLSSLTGSLGVMGRGGGVGTGDGVMASSDDGGGVLEGVAGLQYTNTTHMQCLGGNNTHALYLDLVVYLQNKKY